MSTEFLAFEKDNFQEMKDTIQKLTAELSSTQNELENIILVNIDLNRQLENVTRQNKVPESLAKTANKSSS